MAILPELTRIFGLLHFFSQNPDHAIHIIRCRYLSCSRITGIEFRNCTPDKDNGRTQVTNPFATYVNISRLDMVIWVDTYFQLPAGYADFPGPANPYGIGKGKQFV
jgi:hypothetical protein